jgi:hypothetical protein
MKLSLFYNWPVGENSVRVSLGMPNIEDNKYLFRLGLIDEQGSGGWINPGWVNFNEISKLDSYAKRDWKIRIEKKEKEADHITAKLEIDCSKEWPLDAQSGSSVDTGYWI